jgi:hypothetical protein
VPRARIFDTGDSLQDRASALVVETTAGIARFFPTSRPKLTLAANPRAALRIISIEVCIACTRSDGGEMMKVTAYTVLILGCVALTPVAHSATSDEARACVNAFVTENIPNRNVDIRVNDYVVPMPLPLREEIAMHLRAVDKSTGRTVAEANCRVKSGQVSITQL